MDVSRLTKGIFSFSVCAFLGTFAFAQEECVEIENDIARLQCFDQAYEGEASANAMSPEIAFSKFSEIVNSEHESGNSLLNVGAAARENYCDIALVYARHIRNTMSLKGPVDQGTLRVVLFNAGDIAAVEDGYKTTRLRAKRGATLLGFRHYGEELGGVDNMRRLYHAVLDTFPEEGFPIRGGDKYRENVWMDIKLITNESAVDKDKIYEALMDLSRACST